MELIDKSKLLEELKRCEKICEDYMLSHKDAVSQGIANAKRAVCQHIIKIINTLEVKEVDLEKEIELVKGDYEQVDVAWNNDFDYIAKHFFELGLKAKKGERIMTTEEKARAYDKAIDKIKYVMEHGVSPTLNKEDLQDIFSELKESEDTKIMKAIYNALKYLETELSWDFLDNVDILDVYAWLEKQGGKKSSDEVLKIRQEVYQSGYNDGYKHGIEDEKQGKASYFLTPEESLGISSEKYNEIVDECIFGEQKQVDGFDSELNTLLKKYEHLPKEEILGCLNFYVLVLGKEMEG